MFYTLGALIVVVVVATIASRLDSPGRRFAWLGSMLVAVAGGAILVAALLTGNLALFYLSALVLAVAVPLSAILMIAVYRDLQTDPLGGRLIPRMRALDRDPTHRRRRGRDTGA